MSDPTPHLERFESYEQARREFRWKIPQRFNIAAAICRRHADAPTRIALNEVKAAGINTYTFGGLDFLSDKFAIALTESGIEPGDSVAVRLPQSAALGVALFGALKTGALVVPLSMAVDSALLEHALADSVAKALVADESIYNAATAVALNLPTLKTQFVVRDLRPGAPGHDHTDFWSEIDRASSDFGGAETDADSAAFIFYVESRGRLTGVVHSHRSLIGRLTAFEMINNLEVDHNSVFWTSDDWSSANSTLGMIFPAWWYGCSVAAGAVRNQNGFSSFVMHAGVTHAFIRSAQLKAFGESNPELGERSEQKLQRVVSDGPTSRESADWAKRELGVTICEVYSKPETGCLASECERWFPKQAGSAGRPAPGHSVEIIDDRGVVLPPGKIGRIAVHKSDPALFLRYNNDPEGTSAAMSRDWVVTGDTGYTDGDGNLHASALSV
jgi:acetyl-CoA synthetase